MIDADVAGRPVAGRMATDDPLAALDHDERQALAQLAQAQADGSMTRRQWLKLGAALGIGGLVGGGGAAALTGSAEAADTGTAQVGQPGNPADVWLDRLLDGGDNAVLDVDDTGAIAGQNGRPWDFPAVQTEELNNVLYASENLPSLPSIASALDTAEANAPATVAVVDPGTHLVSITEQSAALYWATSDVHLYVGSGVTIKMADNEHSSSEGHVVRVGDGATALSDVSVRGPGTIDGNKANNSASNLVNGTPVYFHGPLSDATVADITVANAPGDATYHRGESNNRQADGTVQNVTVDACEEGIMAAYLDGWTVENCHVKSTTKQDGIEPTTDTKEFRISHNTVENTDQQGIDIFGGASEGLVADNTVRRWGSGAGIHLSDTNTASENVTVRDNQIHDQQSGDPGLAVAAASTNIEIIDNEVFDVTGFPVEIAGACGLVEISDNTFKNAGDFVSVSCNSGNERVLEGNYIYNVTGSTASRSVSLGGNGRIEFLANVVTHPGSGAPNDGVAVFVDDGYTANNIVEGSDFGSTAISDSSAAGHTITGNHT